MATTLSGVVLAEPAFEQEGYTLRFDDIGTMHTTADGGLVYDYVGTRYRFTLKWNGITAAERDTIRTRAADKTSQAFSPPDTNDTYTVLVVPGSWTEAYIEDGDSVPRYFCELELQEIAV
jgi:hypothetical protein